MNVANGGVLSFRDEGPAEGDVFGPVAEAILFRESNGSGAILIEGSGWCLSETQFVCKLAQIDCCLSSVGEGYNFALGALLCGAGARADPLRPPVPRVSSIPAMFGPFRP